MNLHLQQKWVYMRKALVGGGMELAIKSSEEVSMESRLQPKHANKCASIDQPC